MSPHSPLLQPRLRRLRALQQALVLLLAAIAGGQLYAHGHGAGVAALAALGAFGVGAGLGRLLLRRYRSLLAAHLTGEPDTSRVQPAPGEPTALPRIQRKARSTSQRRRRLLHEPGQSE